MFHAHTDIDTDTKWNIYNTCIHMYIVISEWTPCRTKTKQRMGELIKINGHTIL